MYYFVWRCKLGRGGGGSFGGGGRSSGGSFGGSRSSGGRSGGGFSSGRSGGSFGGFGGSSGGSFGGGSFRGSSFGGGPIFRGPIINPFFGGFGGGPYRRSSGGVGCLTVIIIFIILLVVLSIAQDNSSNGPRSSNITPSTIQREALPKGAVNETDYFTDELGWINNNTKLLSGLKYFYQKTGVQPYLYITDKVNGTSYPSEGELDEFARNLYDELFTDEAHLLFVFFEHDNSYMDRYVAGTQAKTVIDQEAGDILLDYIDRYYYYSDLTDEEFFSNSFRDAADRMMETTKSPWITVFVVLGTVILVIILFVWWKSYKNQKNIEAKRAEDILKTPLNKFGDSKAEDLAKKYEEEEQ